MAELKKVDKKKNPGLAKLPTKVRNKMGYLKRGGKVMAGMKKKIKKKKRTMKRGGGMAKPKMMGGGIMKKRMKRGGRAK
jgi:hypothetical protein